MIGSKFLCRVVLLGAILCLPVYGQHQIARQVLTNGGGETAGGNIIITSTIGEPFIGLSKNGSAANYAGFWQGTVDLTTSIETGPYEILPASFRLYQNYPNPFNPETSIGFTVPSKSRVILKLFDLLGRQVMVLIDQEMEAGEHRVSFHAKGLPSGVYLYRMAAGGPDAKFVETRKLTYLK